MQKPGPGLSEATDSTTPHNISTEEIREALAQVLSSPEFRASKRSQDFLKFVVEQTLAGRGQELKERTIGVEAFGRAVSYDTNEDGVVRIKASEVRRRLTAYHSGTAGKDAPIRIELPVGGYSPVFTLAHEPLTAHPPPPSRRQTTGLAKFMAASAIALLLAIGVFGVRSVLRRDVLDDFWRPVLRDAASPVLIATAYVPVYEREEPTTARPTIHSPRPQESASSAYVLLNDQYVGGGDLIAATRLAGMLSDLHRPYVVKVGAIAFDDLRNSPTILIGYSSNQWSAVSSQLRYYIDDNGGYITQDGKATNWYPRRLDRQFHTDEDYAIVSRVFDRQTHAMLVEVTGITQYGTEAAAEVVTTADLLTDALRTAPSDWQHKNLQLVLHMAVISNYPATPKVVASYFW